MDSHDEKEQKARSRRLTRTNSDKIQRRLLTVLHRESGRLMDESYEKKLPSESSDSLVNYLKTLKEIRLQEMKEAELLTDEELEAFSKK